MMEVRSYAGLATTWPNMVQNHHGLFTGLLALPRAVGEKLGIATFWMAGLSPLYVLYDAVLQRSHEPLDPLSCLALIGSGVSFIYIPLYLTGQPGRRLSLTTTLLIGAGLAAGLVGLWTSV
jgi:hypothetical protein